MFFVAFVNVYLRSAKMFSVESAREERRRQRRALSRLKVRSSRPTTTCPIDALCPCLEHQSTPPNALLTPCSPFYHIIVSGVADNNFFYYNISFLCPPTIVSEHTCTDILLLFYHMSSSPVLEPPELPGVAALPADPQQALLALVQQLKDGQTEQTKLINKLQKTVLTSRTMINELISAQNDMKSELEKLRASGSGGGECEVCANRRDAAVAMAAVTSTGQTTDELIDTLIEGRE